MVDPGSTKKNLSSAFDAVSDAKDVTPAAVPAVERRCDSEPKPAKRSGATVSDYLEDDDPRLSAYDLVGRLGHGSYGVVLSAVHHPGGERLALKCSTIDDEGGDGVPSTTVREVMALRAAAHPNVVALYGVILTRDHVVLETELMHDNLKSLMDASERHALPEDVAVRYTAQLLTALAHCHSRRIVHRDVKPENVLVSEDGSTIKLCDFGMARAMQYPCGNSTPTTATLWYRPPEGLLVDDQQTALVDVWSAGCVAAEMLTGKITFPGDSEVGTLFAIFRALGTPDEKTWPGIGSMRTYNALWPKFKGSGLELRAARPVAGKSVTGGVGYDLGWFVVRALAYPCSRVSAKAALRLPCFTCTPHV